MLLVVRGGMRVGDLVRYREVLNHRTMEKTDWSLGVLVDKKWGNCYVLTKDGQLKVLWAELVQKAGKKDASR